VTGSSSGTFTYVIEAAPDDLQQTLSSAVSWLALSSATTANSSLSIFSGALGGMRLNASAVSSAILTLRIMKALAHERRDHVISIALSRRGTT
jgi:hypothetical protein